MGLTWAYGQAVSAPNEAEGIAVLRRAVELGVTLFDTADMYGPFTNEELVGKALADHREQVIIATKCGIVVEGELTKYNFGRNGTPAHIRAACDASLRRLRIEQIDLYQLHRPDPNVPIEESIGAMAQLVASGKVRAIGLSEVDVPTLKRAMTVHPIATLESEYSLFERNLESEILPWCLEHNVALLAYSPLGRGLLTGRLKQSDIAQGDFRATLPRFQGEALEKNQQIAQRVETVAQRIGATAAQVALAWLLAKYPNVVPIPGTTRRVRLEENVAAANVQLDSDAMAELAALPAPVGSRYAT